MTRSLKVAIVGSDLPYPPTAGNRIQTLNLALRLARRHRITFIARRNAESAEASRFLREQGIDTHLVDCRRSASRAHSSTPGWRLTWRLLYLILWPPTSAPSFGASRRLFTLPENRCLAGRSDRSPGRAGRHRGPAQGLGRPQRGITDLAALPRARARCSAALVYQAAVAEIRAIRVAGHSAESPAQWL